MLHRKALKELVAWKQHKHNQALLVTGARQVGKTYLIREFAKTNYDYFVEINLFENKLAAQILTGADTTADLIKRISLLSESELVPGKTLVFLDEIQESKEIMTAIKFLVEQADYDFVLSGSLLGIELKNIKSVPVGYLDIVTMYPLDFEEYCTAAGIATGFYDDVRSAFLSKVPLPDYLHDKLTKLFYEYLIVGGMPAVVSSFIETKNLQEVRRIQSMLIALNKQDVSKYNERDSLKIKQIYDLIPAELNSQNKRFLLKDMRERAKFRDLADSFVWLVEAGVALPTYNVDEPKYPLLLSRSSNLFKLFMADVGLLTSTFLKSSSLSILNKNPNVNYGAIFENAVAQELVAAGYALYYFKSKKIGELDFVVETISGTIIPIEVKSGKDYKRHNALNSVIASNEYPVKEGFVFCESNVNQQESITYLPIYMISCLSLVD
jgi:predicted AAA+ superfamily ATPase